MPITSIVEAGLLLSDNTTGDVSTTKHGFTPKAPNDATKFLRGDATWAVPSGGTVMNNICQGRLTTESGVPVSTSDRAGQGTIYFTPYNGNQIALYNGSAWAIHTFTERSLALTVTSGKNYDVFLYDNSSTLTLELSAAWTNDTSRADALTTQDGVYVKSGATTRRLLGTIRASNTNVTYDGMTSRYVVNLYNQVHRPVLVADTTNSWTYATASYRQRNASAANQFDIVAPLAGTVAVSLVSSHEFDNSVGGGGRCAIGLDSTTTRATNCIIGEAVLTNAGDATIQALLNDFVPLGYHYYAELERGGGAGTHTWYGDAGSTAFQTGMTGWATC